MELGVLWADWIAQPPQHRALYLAAQETRRRMDAADARERAKEK